MRHRAVTLIELCLAVALAGVLAALATPRMDRFVCVSRQLEAKTSLEALYVAEEEARASGRGYRDMDEVSNDARADRGLGFEPQTRPPRRHSRQPVPVPLGGPRRRRRRA